MLLQQPLRLLVEDAKTDGAFLRAVLLRFGEVRLRRRLGADEWQKVKSAWTEAARGDGMFFRVVHGGGSRIADELTAHWAGNQAPPSALIAVVDSDRCSPDVPFEPAPGTTWHAAQEACNEVAVRPDVPNAWTPSVFALERRAMENYLPLGALSAGYHSGRKKETADSFVQLVPARRHHYHVKGGLRTALEPDGQNDICSQPSGNWVWKNDLQQSLYAEQGPWGSPLSDSALEALCPGLGNDTWLCWQQDHTTINRASLRAEAGDELERLLDHIIQRV